MKRLAEKLNPPIFKPGDIVVVFDPAGKTLVHRVIQLGQELLGNKHSSFVHAGIAISNEEIIEMGAGGAGLNKTAESLKESEFVVFRCTDPEVAAYVADLAINLQRSLIEEQYPELNVGEQPAQYSFLKAIRSAFDNIPQHENQEHLAKTLKNFEIPKNLFCSEMVVFLYQLAYLHLGKGTPLALKFVSNPSVLYEHLSQSKHFTMKEYKPSEKTPLKLNEPFQGSVAQMIIQQCIHRLQEQQNLKTNFVEKKRTFKERLAAKRKTEEAPEKNKLLNK